MLLNKHINSFWEDKIVQISLWLLFVLSFIAEQLIIQNKASLFLENLVLYKHKPKQFFLNIFMHLTYII